MNKSVKQPERFAGLSYQDLLDRETRPVPAALRVSTDTFLGSEPLSVERYLSREFHELEKRRLWPRVWQSLCRETEIADAGDFYVHDIADTSVLVVRTEGGAIRAYPNACLHRGRQLKDGSGSGLRVDTWGGWVFVNIDGTAPPLREYLGVMVEHFERWAPQDTYKALHIKKVLRCNWKLANEAFIESYHTVATHPQLLPYTGDSNSQYDCFNDYVSRTITPMGVVSPHVAGTTEEQSVHQWLTVYGVAAEEGLPEVPAGVSAREFLGEMNIRRFSKMYDQDLAPFVTHSEVLDAILYSVFPNFAPWAGFRPNVTYRFLPYNDSHDMCTMEIMLLMRYPKSQTRPKDAAVQFVPADQTLAQTPGIEPGLARVFDQDFSNLPFVQKGLRSLQSGHVQLANYQEVRIRHFHQTLDNYLKVDTGEGQ